MALLATTMVGCISFLGIFVESNSKLFLVLTLLDGVVFDWLIRVAGISGILTWISISVIHLRFRHAFKLQNKDLSVLPYRAPLHPYGSYIAILCGSVSKAQSLVLIQKKAMPAMK
jgi:lysine-specific permease